MTAKRIVLAGGSGFIGQSLSRTLLRRGYEVVVLTCSPAKRDTRINELYLDGKSLGGWAAHIEGAQAVVNLAGRTVNCRYHARNRREILGSRLDSRGRFLSRCPLAHRTQRYQRAREPGSAQSDDEPRVDGDGASCVRETVWIAGQPLDAGDWSVSAPDRDGVDSQEPARRAGQTDGIRLSVPLFAPRRRLAGHRVPHLLE